MNSLSLGCPTLSSPLGAQRLRQPWERLGTGRRDFPAGSARECAEWARSGHPWRSARLLTLAARAPGGGDSDSLIPSCAHFKLPGLGELRARRQDEKTSPPPRKFHLGRGGGGAGGNATPAGTGARAGEKGRRERGRLTDPALGSAPPQVTRTLSQPGAPRALCDQMRNPAEGASQMRGDS
ncbi:PREDICTED: uncharacterized protein LOC101372892 [Odobenus rosmarus divergens]|uniref:Uncharacterized protein LOC101372892 n=1 Tax=Odobenus rosmarus divergens TaxID=9708 RepID=A0A9B0GYD5_ODORO